jgi:hypothetical protein
MSIPANPITFKKLVVAKQLYNQSVAQAQNHFSVVNRITAVIGFDLAIETVLKAAVLDLEPTKTAQDFSQHLIQKCEDALKKVGLALPDKGNINRVRKIRNDAQHEARYPNETDLADCRVYTRDFLMKFSLMVWNVDFDKINLIDFVQNENTRDFLTKADSYLNLDDHIEATAHAIAAIKWSIRKIKPSFVGQDISANKTSLTRDERDTIERMQEVLLFSVIGINYSGYIQAINTVGHVVVSANGTIHTVRREHHKDIGKQKAELIIAYCIDTVIQIERHVGDIDNPFNTAS